MVFWDGKPEEFEHFLRGVADFPSVLIIVPPRFREKEKLAEKLGRNILFMEAEDAQVLFKPDFTFHYSKNGDMPSRVSAKLKQDFNILLLFGQKQGEPIALDTYVSPSTAVPLLIYEIFKPLRGF